MYMGSKIDLYCAIMCIMFIVIPLLFLVIFLSSPPNHDVAAFLFVALLLICCSVLWGWQLYKNNGYRLLTVVKFSDNHVVIRTLFKKPRMINYKEFTHCGIASYIHGVLNTSLGSTVRYVILTKGAFPSEYCEKINLWKFDEETVRVEYSKELVEYLLNVLPRKLAFELKQYGNPL